LQITNAGGLYGNARPENFPQINDYRNPLVASAMKTMGYVNMFNRGVRQVQLDLKENGNQPAVFDVNMLTAFKVNVVENGGNVVENVAENVGNVVENGGDVIDNVVENGKNVVDIIDVARKVVKAYSGQLSDRQITILELMIKRPSISATEMTTTFGLTIRTIQRDISKLKELGILEREGGDKGGKWIIVFPKN
jgi:ATP-dependent DNA helicase RecG